MLFLWFATKCVVYGLHAIIVQVIAGLHRGYIFWYLYAEYYVWQQAQADGEIACFHVRSLAQRLFSNTIPQVPLKEKLCAISVCLG